MPGMRRQRFAAAHDLEVGKRASGERCELVRYLQDGTPTVCDASWNPSKELEGFAEALLGVEDNRCSIKGFPRPAPALEVGASEIWAREPTLPMLPASHEIAPNEPCVGESEGRFRISGGASLRPGCPSLGPCPGSIPAVVPCHRLQRPCCARFKCDRASKSASDASCIERVESGGEIDLSCKECWIDRRCNLAGLQGVAWQSGQEPAKG